MFFSAITDDLRRLREQALVGLGLLLMVWLAVGPSIPTVDEVRQACPDFQAPCGSSLDVLSLRLLQQLDSGALALATVVAAVVGAIVLDVLRGPLQWLSRRPWFGGQPDWDALRADIELKDRRSGASARPGPSPFLSDPRWELTPVGERKMAEVDRLESEARFRIIAAVLLVPLALLLSWRGNSIYPISCGIAVIVLLWHAQHLGSVLFRDAARRLHRQADLLSAQIAQLSSIYDLLHVLGEGSYEKSRWPAALKAVSIDEVRSLQRIIHEQYYQLESEWTRHNSLPIPRSTVVNSGFYVNHELAVKASLETSRETIEGFDFYLRDKPAGFEITQAGTDWLTRVS